MERYFCTADDCGHYVSRFRKGMKGRKARRILCDAILPEGAGIKISCPDCRSMYLIGLVKPKEEVIDHTPIDALELLKGLDMRKFAKQT